MWFHLLSSLCTFRSKGGLHKTIFLAGSFYRQTLSSAAWHYIYFELQPQHDGEREEREQEGWPEQGCVSNLYRDDFHDQRISETATAGNTGPGQHGRPYCLFNIVLMSQMLWIGVVWAIALSRSMLRLYVIDFLSLLFCSLPLLVDLLCIDPQISPKAKQYFSPPPITLPPPSEW